MPAVAVEVALDEQLVGPVVNYARVSEMKTNTQKDFSYKTANNLPLLSIHYYITLTIAAAGQCTAVRQSGGHSGSKKAS